MRIGLTIDDVEQAIKEHLQEGRGVVGRADEVLLFDWDASLPDFVEVVFVKKTEVPE